MSKSRETGVGLSNYFVGLFLVFALSTGAALTFLVNEHHHEMSKQAAIRTAKTTAENIDYFRAFYSKQIVQNVLGGNVDVTHEYHGNSSAIPLPATLSIELGDFMRDQDANIDYKIFSDFPFPWRLDRELDRDEIDILQKRPGDEAVIDTANGDIRFFSPVVMGETCVSCHNTHAASPKVDWKVGDVRGYQVITLPKSFLHQQDMAGMDSFDQIVVFFAGAFGSAFIVILILVGRNKAAFARVQEFAASEAAKGRELAEANLSLEKGLSELNAVLDNAADGIITIDATGEIISANAAAERIFGYTQVELLGSNVNILMRDADAKMHDLRIANYMQTGEGKIIGVGREVTARRKSGESFPVELSIGHIEHDEGTFFTGIIRDVSERKKAEERLKEIQDKERMLSLVASLTDNAVIITNREGRIRWVNQGFEKISGFSSMEVLGKKPGDILQGPETDGGEIAKMTDAIQRRNSFEVEILNYTKDRAEYWVQIEAQPIITQDGVFDGYIAIERDVTDRKARSDELEEARVAAEESNKSKSRFLAMMSHEIRTPLNAIIGCIGLLRDEEDVEKRMQFIETAKMSAENLQTIINDVLDISKLEVDALKLEPTVSNPLDVVRDVVAVMEPRAVEKGLYLEWSVPTDTPQVVNTDVARLRQVLINFVSNAIKFTDSGGVRIKFMPVKIKGGNGLRFEVMDTGVGVSQENLQDIFEEFWTKNLSTRNTAPGTGLGLAISRRLAKSLGGKIGVNSQYGRGSCFWVELPVGDVSSSTAGEVREGDSSGCPETFNGHVLIAEDNSANQLVASAMLEKIGLTSDIAADGNEAIAALERRSYDMVLMDVNMPEMDGVEATKIIRARQLAVDMPIVAMTAHVMKGDEEDLRSKGFDDYLSKPFVGLDLRRVLHRQLQTD